MALSEWELWACAREMIRQHGDDAGAQAAMRADALLFDGLHEGAAVWCLIVRRIAALEATPQGLLQ